MSNPSADPDEIETRLYLIGPSTLTAERTLHLLSAVLDVITPVAFLLPSGADRGGTAARGLRDLCADRGTAFFVQDDLDLVKTVGADGVHQSDPGTIGDARTNLDKEQILGASVGRSRDDAMTAGDDGADYVAFGALGEPVDQEIVDLVEWWRDLFVLPSLAFAETADDAEKLVAAGVDFIGISALVWDEPDGPAVGARRLQAMIEKN